MRYKQFIISATIFVFLIQLGCAGSKTSSQETPTVKNQETPTVKNQEATPVKTAETPEKQANPSDYEQIKKKIVDITAKHLGIESKEINADAPLSKQKVAADELDIVEIVMSVEEAFNVEIKDSEIASKDDDTLNAVSVKKLADIVFEKKKPKK